MTDQLANNYLKLLSDSLNVQGMIILVTFLGIVGILCLIATIFISNGLINTSKRFKLLVESIGGIAFGTCIAINFLYNKKVSSPLNELQSVVIQKGMTSETKTYSHYQIIKNR